MCVRSEFVFIGIFLTNSYYDIHVKIYINKREYTIQIPISYVNESSEPWSSHEDPVHRTGLGVRRQEVRPIVVLS